jgi:hypothetical protein
VRSGGDTHENIHVAAALDQVGRWLDAIEIATTLTGYAELRGWASDLGTVDQIGIEGTGSHGAGSCPCHFGATPSSCRLSPTREEIYSSRAQRKGRSVEATDTDIEALLARMDDRLAEFRRDDDSRQVFLTVYRAMTETMHRSLRRDMFLDPAWSRDLTLRFAGLYFDADEAFVEGSGCPEPWDVAFRAAQADHILVLEHALLGINAHIVYDLPRAVADTLVAFGDTEGEGDHASLLARRRFDFEVVNHLLARTTDQVQLLLAEHFTPTIRLLDRLAFRLDEYAAEAFLRYARTQGWHTAVAMAFCRNETEREVVRAHLERVASDYATRVDITQFVPTQFGRRIVSRWRGRP